MLQCSGWLQRFGWTFIAKVAEDIKSAKPHTLQIPDHIGGELTVSQSPCFATLITSECIVQRFGALE